MMTIGTKIKIKNHPLTAFIGQTGIIVCHAPDTGGAIVYKVRVGDMILPGWFREEDVELMRRPYKTLLFDLDGTLTDISAGFLKTFNEVLLDDDIQTDDIDSLRPFIGQPVKTSFLNHYGFSEEQATAATDRFMISYDTKGITEQCLFPGIRDLLDHLYKEGFRLVLYSTRPIEKVSIALSVLHISSYFSLVAALHDYMTPKSKSDMISGALRQLGMDFNKSNCVVIGDRRSDMEAAALNGIDAIGVLWGYGTAPELKSSGAKLVVMKPEGLKQML